MNPLHDPLVLICGGLLLAMIVGSLLLKDGRGSKNKTSHGSAGWGTDADLAELIADENAPLKPGEIVLAPWGRKKMLRLTREMAERMVMTIGPPGSGKSRKIFLINAARYIGSFLMSDPKSEAWILTSGYRKNPVRYAPRDPDNSHCFNPVPLCVDWYISLMLGRALAVTDSNESQNGADKFFVGAETAFYAALLAHAATFLHPTLPAMYDFFTSFDNPNKLTAALMKSKSTVCQKFARIFNMADPKLKGAILLGVGPNLAFLLDDKVRRFTSATDEVVNFGNLREKESSIYWCVNEQDAKLLMPLSCMFFTLALHQLKAAQGTLPVCFFLDEFANIGRIPQYDIEIAVLRGRGIAQVLGFQDYNQAQALYGPIRGKVILGSCGTKIAHSGLDYDSAEYISRSLGDKTIVLDKKSRSKSSAGFMGKESVTYSKEERARRVLTADEVRRIQRREMILISGNFRPALTGSYWFEGGAKSSRRMELPKERTMPFTYQAGQAGDATTPEGGERPRFDDL